MSDARGHSWSIVAGCGFLEVVLALSELFQLLAGILQKARESLPAYS